MSMHRIRSRVRAGLLALALVLGAGCATMPGGIASSSTPLDGRKYRVLERTAGTDSRVCLFGLLPVTGSNSIRSALESAKRRVSADALIDVTVEGYSQWWILFTRDVTRVEGVGIRFTD